MKNWEKYEKEIREFDVESFTLLDDGTITDCHKLKNCKGCAFNQGAWNCVRWKTEWLYQEYEEKPTLTKTEAEFLKVITNGYIARNSDGSLWLFSSNPRKDVFDWFSNCYVKLNENVFKFITWESGKAWSLDELRKLGVKDD